MTPDLALALQEKIGDNGVLPGATALAGGWNPVVEDENGAVLADLIKRGKAGDERALEALYEMHKTRIFHLACRHTYNPVVAEDLLQDTFVKVFSHLDDVKDPATFPAWLYRVALNTCYSYLRGKKLRSETMVPLSAVQGRLDRLERGGIVVSRLRGRTRLYQLNPRWAFRDELLALLRRGLYAMTPDETRRYYRGRTRPRRRGKPL